MSGVRRLETPPHLTQSVTGALLGSSITLLHAVEQRAEFAFTLPTPAGESPPFFLLWHKDIPFWYVAFHGINFMRASENVPTAFVRTWYVLHRLGVRDVISGAATGCIRSDMRPGDLVVMEDFIDFSIHRPRSILYEFWEHIPSTPFVPFVPPVCPELKTILESKAAHYQFGQVHSGVFGQFEGPRFETPAEIRFARAAGADMVAQHNATEAIYARELGVHYGALLFVTNFAAGLGGDWVPPAVYEEQARQGKAQAAEFLFDATVAAAERSVRCRACVVDPDQPAYVQDAVQQISAKPVYR